MANISPKHFFYNEYTVVKNHIASKAKNLWKHDNCTRNHSASDSRQTHFSLRGWKRWIIDHRVFWVLYDNTIIKEAITTDWVTTALKSLPKIERERCVYDILDILLKTGAEGLRENYQKRLGDYSNFLKSSYGYIVEVTGNEQNPNFNKNYYEPPSADYTQKIITEGITLSDNIFRIKLFDSIGEQKDTTCVKSWFNSGLFHCLKHFSIGGINIAGNQKNDKTKYKLSSFCELVRFYIIKGLYFTELKESKKKENTFESLVTWDNGDKHKIIFYLEKNNGVYSLDTIIPQPTN